MDYRLPMRITDENDLEKLESYLKAETSNCRSTSKKPVTAMPQGLAEATAKAEPLSTEPHGKAQSGFFQHYLMKNIGKPVRVESLIGNSLEGRVGILLSVGADYIVIKLYGGSWSTLIRTEDIKYITVAHDNEYRMLKHF